MSEVDLQNSFSCLPNEILLRILGLMDVISMCKMICTEGRMCELVKRYKWEIIDNILYNQSDDLQVMIPLNIETYYNYIYIVDFSSVIYYKRCNIPENVIANMSGLIDMNLLSTHQVLSEDLIKLVYKDITFLNLIKYQILPMTVLKEIITNNELDNTHWHIICTTQRLDLCFLETYYEKIDWYALSSNSETISNTTMSRVILQRYTDKFIWVELTGRGLTEEIICDNLDKINSPFCWYNIAYTSRLSSDFIRRHKEKLDKMVLFSCQELEEEMIIELLNECSDDKTKSDLCNKLASTQKLSTEFIQHYKDCLPLYQLIRNQKILRNSLKTVFG